MPETFDADWLTLREPADRAARERATGRPGGRALWAHLTRRDRPSAPLRILDLGSGHGSNLRYLAPRIPAPQHWTLVDHDGALLARAHTQPVPCAAGQPPPARSTRICDLSSGRVLPGLFEAVRPDLVTASALLDLVSADWLQTLVTECLRHGCAWHFALTYAGRFELKPPHEDDAWMVAAINAHQHRDKGFGPALGPDAPATLATLADARGAPAWRAESPWSLSTDDAALASALVEGWAAAATEQHPREAARIAAWRTAHMHPRSVRVVHENVTGLPPDALLSLRS